MQDKAYLAGFLLLAGILLWLGHEEIRGSLLLSWGLSFGGAAAAAILVLVLYRIRLELAASRHELARKEAELSFAHSIQKELFPRRFPASGGLEFDAVCIPARGISGDYYDVLELPDGRQIFAIADISGKGISAAILMASLQAILRVVARTGAAPEDVCGRINGHLCEITDAARYATFFYGEYHPQERTLRYVNAGHYSPFVFGPSAGAVLDMGGVPLGIVPGLRYQSGEMLMKPGDLLAFFSDGITEAGVRSGEEFGEGRLARIIDSKRCCPLKEIREAVLRSVREWTGEEVDDDMTLLLIKATDSN